MRGGVDLFELPDRDMGINLRRLQTGMPELLLDVPDVGPVLQHERRAGVAEQVATAAFTHTGTGDVAGD